MTQQMNIMYGNPNKDFRIPQAAYTYTDTQTHAHRHARRHARTQARTHATGCEEPHLTLRT